MSDERLQPADDIQRRCLRRSLPCARCGYDLRGLPIGGSCPECGTEVWDSVQAAVDPAARRLPLIRNPPRVGNGLLVLMLCLFTTTLLVFAGPMADRLLLLTSWSVVSWTPPALTFAAGVVALAGLLGAWNLAPPRGKEPRGAVWRDIWLLGAGLAGIGGSCIALWAVQRATGQAGLVLLTPSGRPLLDLPLVTLLAAAVISMYGVGGVLTVIGARSRAYRTARGDRQRVREMVAALLGVGVGVVLRQVAQSWDVPWLPVVGDIILFVCALMLLIGLLYLLVNAWWIRRSLLRPPPTLEELLRQ